MSRFGFKLYERPNSPFWWVYFTIKSHPKPYRLSTEVAIARRGEAETAAVRLLAKHHGGGTPLSVSAAGKLDVKTVNEMFVEQLEEEHRPKKYVDRITTDLAYIEKLWTSPAEVTSESWKTKKPGMHKKNGGALGWRSIAHLANTLRHLLRYCAEKGIIASVPEIRLSKEEAKAAKAEKAPRLGMDEEQREAFLWALALAGEDRAVRIYTSLFETWTRKSTLQAMTPRWIDFKRERITIPAQFIKGRREKIIDLTPRAAEAIRAELAAHEKVELDQPIFGYFDFHQANNESRGGGVFGKALTVAGIDRHGLTPHHSTRHTAATIAGGKPGATLAGLMAQGCWDSARIVEENYLHPTLDDARRVTRSA